MNHQTPDNNIVHDQAPPSPSFASSYTFGDEGRYYATDSGKISTAQKVFIDLVSVGCNIGQAYQEAYPKSSVAAAYSSASRLMDRPSIQRAIKDATANYQDMMLEERRKPCLARINELKEQRLRLSQIINGEILSKTTIWDIDTGATKVRMHEDPMSIIQAIKLDIKLADMLAAAEATVPPPREPSILEGYEMIYGADDKIEAPEPSGPYVFISNDEDEDYEDDDNDTEELDPDDTIKKHLGISRPAKPKTSQSPKADNTGPKIKTSKNRSKT